MIKSLGVSALMVLAVFSAAATAQSNAEAQAEFKAAVDAADKAKVVGPADVRLADQAVLKLPAGYYYFPSAEAGRLLVAMGNRTGEGLLGMIVPEGQGGWFVVMRFHRSGYVRDDDAKDWNAAELLQGLKEGTEDSNRERRARGIPEIEVVGWVEAPKYDAATHRLIWSLESKDKGAPANAERGVNYNTYALGREGYVSMNLVTGMSTIQAEKPTAHMLLAALQYNAGKGYGDFNESTDRVAEYGLAALIGGIAAKKLGLLALILGFLAKFAKILGIAVVGLGAAVLQFFKRRKAEAPPAP